MTRGIGWPSTRMHAFFDLPSWLKVSCLRLSSTAGDASLLFMDSLSFPTTNWTLVRGGRWLGLPE